MSWDCLVIGAGHNGLTAAATLAKRGLRVLVLEQRPNPGGLAGELEFHPGFRVPGIFHDTSGLDPRTVSDLELEKHGLQFTEPETLLGLAPGISTVTWKAGEVPAGLSQDDASGYQRWRGQIEDLRSFALNVLASPPPPLTTPEDLKSLAELGWSAFELRRLGREKMFSLLRILPMSAADWLEESIRHPLLAEVLAFPAVFSNSNGPRAAGTAANLLLHESRNGRPVKGGPSGLIAALSQCALAAKVEIRPSSRVMKINLESGRVNGVRLADGSEIKAPRVIASCDPQQTFLQLVPSLTVGTQLESQFLSYRCRGSLAKIHVALAGPPSWPVGGHFPRVRIGGGSLNHLERVFDALKYNAVAAHPALDIQVVPQTDGGPTALSVLAAGIPFDLEGGWSPEARQGLADAVLDRIDEFSPGLRTRLLFVEVLAPPDLEANYCLSGGHLFHGDHALDQLLFMRPTAATARYGTPIPGLFLGGSGSHPGGGVTTTPGRLAAETLLKLEK